MNSAPTEHGLGGSKAAIDWATMEQWDRSYYLHAVQALDEFSDVPIERAGGNYLVLPDGTRLVDFQSQLISDSVGHRHPRVHAEIKEAMTQPLLPASQRSSTKASRSRSCCLTTSVVERS